MSKDWKIESLNWTYDIKEILLNCSRLRKLFFYTNNFDGPNCDELLEILVTPKTLYKFSYPKNGIFQLMVQFTKFFWELKGQNSN